MTPEEWQQVRSILESALELDSADRPAFLDESCADPFLRREVESLIAVHEQAGTEVLNSFPFSSFSAPEEARFRFLPGRRVGAYEIHEEIAVGGMGAVYRAIRADGQYRQQVALKIIRLELGAESTAARFRNERQILASFDHPNIGKILDGGTTADGLPYFVMEFIEGLPITEYCDQHKLSIDARLRIFRTVCSAVHHAHQHSVIHRDIKPSNILVTAAGVPKLLDFGIAKILDPSSLPENAATLTGQWVMTPEYASPEQLRGEASTTASDVYSLGLVLYELLTGHRAYRILGHLPYEIARVVLETDPEKPSTAVLRKDEPATRKEKVLPTPELVSGLRADTPEKLRGRLEGDLDNIVLKAIQKDPRERYSSVEQLSEDIRRHLEALPVMARKSTITYRGRKYILRHKVGMAAAALVFASLLTGIALRFWLESPAQPSVVSFRQLTDDGEAKDELAAIDTDGSHVYFTETYLGMLRLAQVSVSGGQVAPVSTQIPAAFSATMAPDFSGLLVVENYVRGSHPLWFQRLPAGPPRRLGSIESLGAVFTPQNDKIVFVDGPALYSAVRNGANVHKICDLPGSGSMPAVSPDGKRIRVTVLESLNNYSLWEVGFDGKGLHALPYVGNGSSVGFGRWTPDGRHFVFQSPRPEGTNIWAVSESPGFLRGSVSSPTQLTNGPLSCSQPTPSRDGKQIFARCAKLRGELVRYDRKSQEFIPFLGGISALDVTYSRDGEWVVYVSYPDRALWRMRANGSDRLQLINSPMTAWYPQISPDGTKIAFGGVAWRASISSVYIVSLAGGEPEKIVEEGDFPYWSPDGNSVAFGSLRPGTRFLANTSQNFELRIIDLKSGKVSTIPHSEGKSGPVWISPTTLVAALNAGLRLVRYDFRTQTWSDLAAGPFSDWTSTDGKYVYCTTIEPATPAALRIRVSDGQPEPLADLRNLRRINVDGAKEVSLTPNGVLLFTRDIGTEEIYALNVKWP